MNYLCYCQICEIIVKTNRGKLSNFLAFLSAFGGICMIIYILYYLDHKANNCVHCNTVWQDTILEIKPEQQNYQNNMEILVKFNYCSCHDEQVKREDAKFYFSCG